MPWSDQNGAGSPLIREPDTAEPDTAAPRDRGAERAARLARLARAAPGAPALQLIAPALAPEPEPEPVPDLSELERLPGIGPGLVRALGRAGLAGLAAVAGTDPAGLAQALGPLGRLVPTADWIAFARAETRAETSPGTIAEFRADGE